MREVECGRWNEGGMIGPGRSGTDKGTTPLIAAQRCVAASTWAGSVASFHVCVASFDTKISP